MEYVHWGILFFVVIEFLCIVGIMKEHIEF